MNLFKKEMILSLVGAAFIMVATGCGIIPDAYRGNYEDKKANVKVTLEANGGTMTFSDGRVLKSDANDLTYDNLLTGKPGIYVSKNPTASNLLDVFWVNSDLKSRQESGGLVWYQSEVMYTLFDSNRKDAAITVQLVHCVDGNVMLDAQTKTWEVGCPAGPDNYMLSRADDKSSDQKTSTTTKPQTFQELPTGMMQLEDFTGSNSSKFIDKNNNY